MDILLFQQRIALREDITRLTRERDNLLGEIEQIPRQDNNQIPAEDLRKKRRAKKKPKPFKELCPAMRARRKRTYETSFNTCCLKLDSDVQRVKVNLTLGDGTELSFCPRDPNENSENVHLVSPTSAKCPLNILHRAINIKDKFRISDEAMHELHMLGQPIPCKNQLQEEKKRVSTVIPIRQADGIEDDCSYRHLGEVLDFVLELPKYEELFRTPDPVQIMCRFSCDGAKITKKQDSVRGVVKVLHPRNELPDNLCDLSMSPEDELTLFFFMGDENRPNMLRFSAETFRDMRNAALNGITIGDKKIEVNWLLTCDWKAVTILKGINAANSQYFCLWCHCTKAQICDFSIPSWDIQRSEAMRRTHLGKKIHKGYIAEDLCDFIDFAHIVPDDLHLRIRIALKLFNQVVIWAIDQKKEEDFQREMKRIHVPFSFWNVQGDNNSGSVKKWSQPSGDELHAIIKKTRIHNILDAVDKRYTNVDGLTVDVLKNELGQRGKSTKGKKADLIARLKETLEGDEKFLRAPKSRLRVMYGHDSDEEDLDIHTLNIDAIQDLWERFGVLMESLRSLPSNDNYMTPETFKTNARAWAEDFRKYTFDEDVTPYIHCMVYHVPQSLAKYRYIHDIGVSQVERKNYDHRLAYFGSTNRNGGKWKRKISLQILERENRLLWAKTNGVERVKRAYNKRRDCDNMQ